MSFLKMTVIKVTDIKLYEHSDDRELESENDYESFHSDEEFKLENP